MDQHYDDLFGNAQKATDKGRILKLPCYQKNLKYNFEELYSYSTKITHLDLPGTTVIKLGMWPPTNTAHYNYTRRFFEDHYGIRNVCQTNL